MIRARFRLDLRQVGKDLDDVALLVQQKVAFQVLEGVVNMTPVDTGRARGNWQVTVGAASGAFDETGFSASAAETIQRGVDLLAGLQRLGAVYITNNTPYIIELEKGSSKQAPQGMVQVTLDRVGAQF